LPDNFFALTTAGDYTMLSMSREGIRQTAARWLLCFLDSDGFYGILSTARATSAGNISHALGCAWRARKGGGQEYRERRTNV